MTGAVHVIGQNNSSPSVSSLAITTTEAILAGDTCVLCVTTDSNTVSSITDAGSSWSRADGNAVNGNTEIWYCTSHAALGSGSTITINFSASHARLAATLYRFVAISAPLKDHGAASGNSGSPSVSTSASVNTGVVVFGCCEDTGALTAPGGIWTSDYLANNFGGDGASNFNHCHGTVTGGGVATFNPSASSNFWTATIAAFTPPNAGGFFAL